MIAVTVKSNVSLIKPYTTLNELNVYPSYQLKCSPSSIFIFIFNSVILTFDFVFLKV